VTLSRRALLAAAAGGLGALAVGCSGPAAPAGSPPAATGSAADEVTGPFDWRRAAGTTIAVLLPEHLSTRVLQQDLGAFTALTGVQVRTSVLPEATYFDRVTTELVSGLPTVDVFMTGAYMVWQYAPPGWMEDLDPWVANPCATSDEHDEADVLPALQSALRWDLVLGHATGTGGRWALPWGWDPTVLAYRADVLDRLGLRPPQSLPELDEVARATARHMAATVDGGYGLAVRGTRSWAAVDAGFITQLTREGGRDFSVEAGHLVPAVDSDASVRFHRRWLGMVRDAGPPRWTEQTSQGCASHLLSGRAALSYDTSSAALAGGRSGARAAAGPLGWSPGPAGPSGDHASHVWVRSLAMSSRSQRKVAAWLFLQWATGAAHARTAVAHGSVGPARRSVLESGAYRDAVAVHTGYLETVEALRAGMRVAFTPQPAFFDTTTAWAATLQDVHAGADAAEALGRLADRMRRRS
jgi:multiple sugar transport system substrate-binding protein